MINGRTGEPLPDLETLRRSYRDAVEDALTVFMDTVKTLAEPMPGCDCRILHRRMKRMLDFVGDARYDLACAVYDKPEPSR